MSTAASPLPHVRHPRGGLPARVKIIATLGPASESPDMVHKLIEAGVSVFRLNFSHGDLSAHLARLNTVRRVARELARPIAVLGDLCGPKIRIGVVPAIGASKGIELARGQEVVFRADAGSASVLRESASGPEAHAIVLPTTYPAMIDEVQPGHRVLINDGAIRMLALQRDSGNGGPHQLRCRVMQPGLVTSGKGINLPDSTLSVPAITQRDWECVAWAVEHALDFLALSFVRSAGEVLLLKERLAQLSPPDRAARASPEPSTSGVRALIAGATIPVIAKIEKPQALANLESIIEASDAIMVARGDLGVEMDIAHVPVAQRQILRACAAHGRPCIVATQMLETMIEASSPTRAEASDVGHAVFDGADCVMLSAETAVGKHPALVADTMRRIIGAAEAACDHDTPVDAAPAKWIESGYGTAGLAHGAWHIARDLSARLIVCWSQNGGTARYLSHQGFRAPIVAYTSSESVARRMALLRNVTPIWREPPASGGLGDFTDIAERDMLTRGWIRAGEPMLILAGKPLGAPKATNSIATLYVGDPNGGYRAHKS